MSTFFSRPGHGAFVFYIFCVASFVWIYNGPFFSSEHRSHRSHRPHYGLHHSSFNGEWNPQRDSKNLLLTDMQCDIAFPGLFKEIERAVDHRKGKRITKEEIDGIKKSNGFVRAMIYDQQLYIIDSKGTFFSREYATIQALHRAIITSPEPIPNIEFAFLTDDIVRPQPIWAYSRKEQGSDDLWLMPDFGYWSWPEPKIGSYSEVQRKAATLDAKTPWKQKISKLVWRGAILGLPIRKKFESATKDKEWADVQTLNWRNKTNIALHRLNMEEHCKYKFLAHTEGTSSSGRLKYLQNCRSVIVAHELNWVQHYHHLMIPSGPNQNFVQVKRDFSDLESTMKDLQKRDDLAERIAENSVATFAQRYLTPAAEVCYWRRLFRGWKSISFEPEFYEKTGNGEMKWRGLPVESFLLERRLDWEPY